MKTFTFFGALYVGQVAVVGGSRRMFPDADLSSSIVP